ncbi:hypothetical protein CC85DRAFT_329427 [Cutaneotrichosporon oleaginosum]|uniref:YMC020W-like alpha/beta hydrolase domain-containing protein n=1 Tax=Cutaneotrichosporon oleaginosum TaxID=879819 RepID=A0A0J0XIR9_9TREE|nr:uncharacterized protein CC85DRAFT_329427 [Cutaneotrichosporon oleaginosum]KLT40963.1 hypothetical protein CC85DRAFT_329427 [Cutaneotrichosporon oleaginosum]TXT06233.1 hypothetical protein COLE_05564 [Cutaneotrichosporon oleaginosum]
MSARNHVSSAPRTPASSVRRPPSALRGAPGSRGRVAAAKAHVSVSLVFAHGDAVQADGSASEEALSRQLDRDTAGERISLRSRRSSVATLASMRSGYSSYPLSAALPEEEEAGPSTLRSPHPHLDPTSSASLPPDADVDADSPPPTPRMRRRRASSRRSVPQDFLVPSTSGRRDTTPERRNSACAMDEPAPTTPRLNPKQSGAWLRWNSPAPSFPRKDKGKARADSPGTATAARADHDDVRQSGRADRMQPVPAPPATAAAHEQQDEATVSTLIPSQPLTSSPTSTFPLNTAEDDLKAEPEPEPEPEPGTPDPTTPIMRPADPPTKTTPAGWRAYFWGGGGESSTAAHHLVPPPILPNDMTDPAVAAAELALARIESRASARTNGSMNGSVKRRKRVGSLHTVSAVATPSPSAPPSPRTSTSIDRRSADKLGKQNSKIVSKTPAPVPSKACANSPKDKDTHCEAKPEPTSVEQPVTKSTAAILAAPPPVEGSLLPPAEITSERSSSEAQRPRSRSRSPSTAAAPAQGWGSYLTSWVYPTTTQPASTRAAPPPAETTTEPPAPVTGEQVEPSTIVQLSNPAEDQKPAAENPSPTTNVPAPTNGPEIELPPDEPQPTSSSAQQQKYASSAASTSGWLSYLAFRATQKTITASTKTLDGEEVMDMENDPDFPQAEEPKVIEAAQAREGSNSKATGANVSRQASLSQASKGGPPVKATGANLSRQTSASQPAAADKLAGSQSKATGVVARGKTTEFRPEERRDSISTASVQPQPTQKLAHKRSQNLSTNRSRRLSNASSTRTAVSASQPPPSPRVAQANGQAQAIKGASDLPGTPKPAPKQQNFIIPTFDITFDRPPRSLLPRNPEPPGAAGLALRAFNYVYSTQPVDPPHEKRGKKAGRDIGANLPRRIGLGGGSPDDGWRDVERVVVIGVHGWFPAKMLTSVIGEPTGTSTKFANMMGEAVRKFFKEKDVDENDIRLTLIPLEGEGTIEHRVDKLYKQYLSNPAWINDLRRADAILFAAHSQGCIVTTHLISRMIAQGHIRTATNREATARCEWAFGPIGIMPNEDSKKGRQLAARMSGREGGRQKVAMLAMCGVHLGPFYSISTSSVIQPYLQWFENAAARELFEFQDTTSAVSVAYQRALAMVVENEVKVLLLSSLNDQVVPIYGASFATASHPLLLRALYVDGASYSASDFMTNLLCFAFMLRNAGIDDQRLIEHLSEATAGSLTGVGHSTPYEELGCYSMAVQYLFHAGPAAQPMPPLEVEPFAARDSRNDFELPWIMRALVDSPEVKDLFPDELRTLRDNITAWKPTTKALKEIKKRLEPMAGRQRLSPLSQLATSGSSTSLASDAAAPGVQPGTAHAKSHANANANSVRKQPAPAPKAVMTMVGR